MSKKSTSFLSGLPTLLFAAILTLTCSIPAFAAGDDDDGPKVPEPVMTPAYGSTIPELQTVTLDFGIPVQENTAPHESIRVGVNGSIVTANFDVSVNFSGTTVTVTLNPALSNAAAPGQVIFPDGYFYFPTLGISNPEQIDCRYTITGTATAAPKEITPANGSKVTELSQIAIYFENGDVFEGNQMGRCTLKYNDDAAVSISNLVTRGGLYGEYYALVDFSEAPYTADGKYVVTIPAGWFNVRINGALTPSEKIELTYFIGEGGGPVGNVPTLIDPADGDVIAELSKVTMYWGGKLVWIPGSGATLSYNGNVVNIDEYVSRNSDWDYSFIELRTPYTEPGDYTFNFPAGYFLVGEMGNNPPSDAFTFSYTIPAPVVGTNIPVSIDPEDGAQLEELSEVTLFWGDKMNWISGSGATLMYNGHLVDIDNEWMTRDWDWHYTYLNFPTPYTEPGEYTLTFPAGMFKVGEMGNNPESDAFSVSYFIKGGGSSEITTFDIVSATPAGGSEVETLKTVTLQWQDGLAVMPSVEAQQNTILATLAGNGQTLDITSNRFSGMRPFFNPMTLTLAEEITSPGEYILTVPQGYFTIMENGENAGVSAEIRLVFTVTGKAEVELVTIREDVPFQLIGSQSLEYQGVFTPSMTGKLTISYDPAATVLSVRPVLFAADRNTAIDYTLNDEATEYYYELTEGQQYYYLMGSFNPEGYTLYKAGTYTVTFSMSESQGGGGEGPGGDEDEPVAQPLSSYELAAFTGSYSEISGGKTLLNMSIFDALVDDALQKENGEMSAILIGDGQISCPMIPGEALTLPGIPFGFEFPYAGETYTHFLVSPFGYVMLGGETIGNIVSGGLMGGAMGKYIFNQDVPNVLGCVDFFQPYCLANTEISYVTDATGLTVQFKNWGFKANGTDRPGLPVNMQLKLAKDGTVSMVYSGWDVLSQASEFAESCFGQVYVALKGAGNDIITLKGAGEKNDLYDATLLHDAGSANLVNIYPTLPDGYTLAFSPSQSECEAPEVSGKLSILTTSTTLTASYEPTSGQADAYLIMLGESFMMWQPEDGVKYEPGQQVTSMTGAPLTVVSAGAATEVVVENLNPNTRYYIGVWPYNTIGVGAPKYQMGYGFPPANGSEMTMAAAPKSLEVVGQTLNSITLDADGNEDGDDVIIIMTQNLSRDNNISDNPIVGDLNPYAGYEVGDEIEGGGKVVYIGEPKEGIVIDGLDNSTPYYFASFTNNDYGYGYVEYSSDAAYASGTTVVLPPYDMDFSLERRFVAPAGWSAYWSTGVNDGFAVWMKTVGGGISGGTDLTESWFLRFALGGVSSSKGAIAWCLTSPIAVQEAGYVAEMEFTGEIYPESPRDPAGPLALADGDYISLSVTTDGGKTFTEAMKYTKDNFNGAYTSNTISADLSDYVGKEVQLKFEWKTSVTSGNDSGGSQLFITSYRVENPEIPSVKSVSEITDTSAKISINSPYDANEIAIVLKGETPVSGERIKDVYSYTVQGLERETSYDVYVRGVVSEINGIFTPWSEAYGFTTAVSGVDGIESGAINVFAENGIVYVDNNGLYIDSVTVYDITGKVVARSVVDNTCPVALDAAGNGMVIIVVKAENGENVYKLIVK